MHLPLGGLQGGLAAPLGGLQGQEPGLGGHPQGGPPGQAVRHLWRHQAVLVDSLVSDTEEFPSGWCTLPSSSTRSSQWNIAGHIGPYWALIMPNSEGPELHWLDIRYLNPVFE